MAKTRYRIPLKDEKRFLASLTKALARRDEQGVTDLDHVTRALVRNAKLGKEASIAMIADRIDGKVMNDILGIGGGEAGEAQSFEVIAIKAVYPKLIDATPANDEEAA